MRLSNLLIVFIIHALASFYVLSDNSIDYSGFGSFLLYPVKPVLSIIDITYLGYMSYVPYLVNSLIWSFLINYFYNILKNTARDKFD